MDESRLQSKNGGRVTGRGFAGVAERQQDSGFRIERIEYAEERPKAFRGHCR
jgi:hypothetical protein